MSMQRKTPKEILESALASLRAHGWRQGGLVSAGGKMCMLGAINYADKGNPRLPAFMRSHSADIALKHLAGAAGVSRDYIPSWNDNPLRTFDDVKRVFLRAIKSLP